MLAKLICWILGHDYQPVRQKVPGGDYSSWKLQKCRKGCGAWKEYVTDRSAIIVGDESKHSVSLPGEWVFHRK